MTAKEFLLQYKWAKREAADVELRITQLRLRYGAPSAINYSDMPKAHNGVDLSDYMVQLERLTDYLFEKYKKCIGIETDIYRRLDQMTDQTEREVLRCRYVDEMTWEQIADHMMYSRRNVTRIHGRALQHFPLG